MKWDSALYDSRHAFVTEYGRSLAALADTRRGQKILDLGCGTGALTHELAQNGAEVVGIDSSEEMIGRAMRRFPGLPFYHLDAVFLPFENEFDTVFSNAVFHWIPDQDTLLSSVFRSLKSGGALICEFGAKGNISTIEAAFSAAVSGAEGAYRSPFFFPSAEEYALLLAQAGFTAVQIGEFDRPTPLSGGEGGLRRWMSQFFADSLAPLSENGAAAVLEKAEGLCRPALFKDGVWTADYRRIRAIARKDAPR